MPSISRRPRSRMSPYVVPAPRPCSVGNARIWTASASQYSVPSARGQSSMSSIIALRAGMPSRPNSVTLVGMPSTYTLAIVGLCPSVPSTPPASPGLTQKVVCHLDCCNVWRHSYLGIQSPFVASDCCVNGCFVPGVWTHFCYLCPLCPIWWTVDCPLLSCLCHCP